MKGDAKRTAVVVLVYSFIIEKHSYTQEVNEEQSVTVWQSVVLLAGVCGWIRLSATATLSFRCIQMTH